MAWWGAAEVVLSESQAKAMGQDCKEVLRDLKGLFPCRDVFGSQVVRGQEGESRQ